MENLISFETAKLAKEKGFDWLCYNFYNKNVLIERKLSSGSSTDTDVEIYLEDFKDNHNNYKDKYSAPTQSLLQKWLRNVHEIFVFVEPTLGVDKQEFAVFATNNELVDIGFNLGYQSSYHVKTYEEALEKGLQETLKLVNNEY